MNLNQKIDLVITKLDNIEKRLDDFDQKYAKLNDRVDALEKKVESKFDEFDQILNQQSESSNSNLQARIVVLEDFIQNIEKAKVMQESYDKRLNILIHGIRENSNNAWEKREETIAKFKNFLKNGLKMDDTEDVEYVDIHRLPQHPVKKNGKTVDRPIIVKLLTTHDKKLIFEAVRNLKAYNTKLKREDETSPSVYVTEHLSWIATICVC